MNSTLAIARTGFRISSALDLYYPEEAGPLADFTGQPSSSFDINIATEVLQHGDTDFSSMKVVAEAEDAWKLLDDGECRWFVSCFDMPNGQPAWAARMNAGCNHITVEYNVSDDDCRGRVPSPILYPLDQLLLIHVLSSRRGVIVHGTGLRRGDDAILLAGVSGAGKTTIAGILEKHSDLEILSDDRIVIREQDGILRAYGTPWPGEGGFAVNASAELKKICFLQQGEVNAVEPLDVAKVFERMMPVTSIPWYDDAAMGNTVSFVESVAGKVPGLDLVFMKDVGAVEIVESLFEYDA